MAMTLAARSSGPTHAPPFAHTLLSDSDRRRSRPRGRLFSHRRCSRVGVLGPGQRRRRLGSHVSIGGPSPRRARAVARPNAHHEPSRRGWWRGLRADGRAAIVGREPAGRRVSLDDPEALLVGRLEGDVAHGEGSPDGPQGILLGPGAVRIAASRRRALGRRGRGRVRRARGRGGCALADGRRPRRRVARRPVVHRRERWLGRTPRQAPVQPRDASLSTRHTTEKRTRAATGIATRAAELRSVFRFFGVRFFRENVFVGNLVTWFLQ